jgi:hypothetical protein
VIEALMARGCEEAGYRLAGAPLDHICCRHLYGNDRMLTAWPASDHAVILTVGPHDRSALDVYELVLAAVAVEVPDQERTKPPCCAELGEPPADAALAQVLAAAVTALAPAHRGRQ